MRKDVRRLQETSETSEYRIGKHQSMENIRKHRSMDLEWNGQEDFGNVGVGKASECGKTSEDCGKRQKCRSVE